MTRLLEEVRLLKDVPAHRFVRLVDSKGNIGEKVYVKRGVGNHRKYQLDDCADIYGKDKRRKPKRHRYKAKQKVLMCFYP